MEQMQQYMSIVYVSVPNIYCILSANTSRTNTNAIAYRIGSVFMPRYRLFLGQCTVHFWASARVNEIHIYSSSRVRISARGGLRGGRSHRKIVQKIEYSTTLGRWAVIIIIKISRCENVQCNFSWSNRMSESERTTCSDKVPSCHCQLGQCGGVFSSNWRMVTDSLH